MTRPNDNGIICAEATVAAVAEILIRFARADIDLNHSTMEWLALALDEAASQLQMSVQTTAG
jgi:hypothetical protein